MVLRDDPDWPLVAALEIFDDETQQARPAAIFTERVVSPPVEHLGVDTASEALAVSLDECGTVDLGRISELLGTDPDTARNELAAHVYEDPATSELVPSSRYLSGNVRRKLEVATSLPRPTTRAGSTTSKRSRRSCRGNSSHRRSPPDSEHHGSPPPMSKASAPEVLGAEVEVEHLPSLGRWTTALARRATGVGQPVLGMGDRSG